MPKRSMLVGPPGTGKTLLAKGSSRRGNVPFFSILGSEFVDVRRHGSCEGRDLTSHGNEKARCIVFE